jgi:DNA ligase-associated metallophosphoesterase
MEIRFRGHPLELDPSGALWWPARRLLLVADLHLEKGSAFARRGALLPPYDSAATLDRLERVMARRRPTTVVSLGDGFHDHHGPRLLSPALLDRLAALTAATRWIWVTGNHDPSLPLGLGGAAVRELALDGLVLRHAPDGVDPGEVAGHLHPKARLASSRARRTRPCFLVAAERLVLPAFGAYTGGVNALDPTIGALFPGGFKACLLGEARVFGVPRELLAAEPDPLQHRLA